MENRTPISHPATSRCDKNIYPQCIRNRMPGWGGGGYNKVTMTLTFFTLNVDVINMSDAHPSLFRCCLYKQTAIYYFIEAS